MVLLKTDSKQIKQLEQLARSTNAELTPVLDPDISVDRGMWRKKSDSGPGYCQWLNFRFENYVRDVLSRDGSRPYVHLDIGGSSGYFCSQLASIDSRIASFAISKDYFQPDIPNERVFVMDLGQPASWKSLPDSSIDLITSTMCFCYVDMTGRQILPHIKRILTERGLAVLDDYLSKDEDDTDKILAMSAVTRTRLGVYVVAKSKALPWQNYQIIGRQQP